MKRILWVGAALWLALPGCAHTYGPEHLPMLRQQAQGCRDFGNESEARRIEAAIAAIEAGGTGHLPPSGVVPRVEVDSWQRREAIEAKRRMVSGILQGLGGSRGERPVYYLGPRQGFTSPDQEFYFEGPGVPQRDYYLEYEQHQALRAIQELRDIERNRERRERWDRIRQGRYP